MSNEPGLTSALPKVSVIILNWNKPDLAISCANSVLLHSPDVGEIIIADNGSTRINLRRLRAGVQGTKCRVLEIGINRYYGEGNNLAVESATGEFIVFLNNDVVVTENWLEPLLGSILRDPTIGAVGPKFIYPDGTLQEAGAFVDRAGHSVQVGKGQNADSQRFNSEKIVHYVSAACLLLRKDDFTSVGGFNFIYEPAYYEDTDLCFSITKLLNKSILFQPSSTVVHQESATTADPGTGLRLNNITELNRHKFLERWGVGGTSSREAQVQDRVDAFSAFPGTGRVGIYTPFDLSLGGGEKYILSVAETLQAAGYDVALITDYPYSRLRLDNLSRELQLDLKNVKLMTYRDAKLCAFDLFITMGNEATPPIDLLGQKNIHHCQFPFPNARNLNVERKRLRGLQTVVVNSEFTKHHYLAKAPIEAFLGEVSVIHPPVSPFKRMVSTVNSKSILSVGRFFTDGHSKRQDVLIRGFIDLLKSEPDAELNLVGGSLPGHKHREYIAYCQALAKGYPVNFFIDSASSSLEEIAERSSIYWHGSGYGINSLLAPEKCEHFGISVVEAMSAGLIPFVVGNGGPASIVEFGKSGFHYHTVENLVRRTKLVFDIPESERQALSANAIERSALYSKKVFERNWQQLVAKVMS